MPSELASWNDTPTRQAIVQVVERVTDESSPDYLPPEERVTAFDNDGTLWCEKPMPIELGFILARFAEMAEADESLRRSSRGRRRGRRTTPGWARRSRSTTTATRAT